MEIKIKIMQKEIETHIEKIKCPECDTVQDAAVEHTIPWYTYIHFCTNCNYLITESYWDTIKLNP